MKKIILSIILVCMSTPAYAVYYSWPGHFGVGVFDISESVAGQIGIGHDGPQRINGLKPILIEQLASQPTFRNKVLRRTELKVPKIEVGSEQWYGFSFYFPNTEGWQKIGESFNLLFQLHATPDPGEPWRHPVLSMGIVKDKWFLERAWSTYKFDARRADVHVERQMMEQSLELDKWHDFVIHAIWKADESGLIEVWKENKLVYRVEGPACFNDNPRPGIYFKTGIYRWKSPETDLKMYVGRLVQESGAGKFKNVSIMPLK